MKSREENASNHAVLQLSKSLSTCTSDSINYTTLQHAPLLVPLSHLQYDAETDEGHHQGVELMFLADLQHVPQLGGVSRQQRHVQHALGDRLLGGIPVRVECLPLWGGEVDQFGSGRVKTGKRRVRFGR